MRLTADYLCWLFLFDDAYVDRVERDSNRFGRAITTILDVLDHDAPHRAEGAWDGAFIDICERLRTVLPHQVFRRFADGMRLYLMSAAWMILQHSYSETLRAREYKAIRRYIDACAPCVALLSLDVDEVDYTDPRLYRMYQHAANVVDWSNDVLSLFVEARQPGQFWNLVLTQAATGLTLQESVETTVRLVQDEVRAFQALEQTVTCGPAARRYVSELGRFMRGIYDWSTIDSKRYNPGHAAEDADDTRDWQAGRPGDGTI